MQIKRPADLARAIKNRRLELELTQAQVASKAGVSRQLLARLENSTGDTSSLMLLKIIYALSLDLDLTPSLPAKQENKQVEGLAKQRTRLSAGQADALTSHLPTRSYSNLVGVERDGLNAAMNDAVEPILLKATSAVTDAMQARIRETIRLGLFDGKASEPSDEPKGE